MATSNVTSNSKQSKTRSATSEKKGDSRKVTTASAKQSVSKANKVKGAGSSGNKSTRRSPEAGTASARSSRPASRATSKNSNGSDGVISKVVKAVTSIFTPGEPDAVDMLKNDHRVVDGLFAKVKANEDGNNRAVFKKIKSELDVHAHIEETVLYPYLLENGKKDLKKIVREGIEEHRQAKMFLAELDGLTGTSEAFKAKLKVLIEDIEHHVKEEEDGMFSMVRDQFSEDVLKKLAAKMSAARERFKKRMANKTVKTPAGKKRATATA